MPDSAAVVHEGSAPERPSISTRHIRQLPNAAVMSAPQNLGSACAASTVAAITLLPAGRVTGTPSTIIVISSPLSAAPLGEPTDSEQPHVC